MNAPGAGGDTLWLKSTDDANLQKLAAEKIALLKLFEKEIPSVMVVHDIRDMSTVYMSELGRQILGGVSLEEVRLSNEEYHAKYFNPDDAQYYVPKIQGLLQRNVGDEMVTYFQQVRSGPQHEWNWYMSSTKILMRDEKGAPLLVITLAVPVDSIHPMASKVDRLMDEQSFIQEKRAVYESLTKREKEILKLMALGTNSNEIAEQLHISEATANTHRRNIRSKINAQTNYDVTKFAQAFNLI